MGGPCLPFFFFFFLLFLGLVSSATILDGVFQSEGGAASRTLLQVKKSCPVDFQNQNYTTLVTQCKGPQYPANLCCTAFKQFACPFSDQINDLTTDCASTMFSYINLLGKYPPGLFANECRDGKDGLDCSTVPPAAPSQKNTLANSGTRNFLATKSIMLVVISSIVGLILQLL
ncbi:hypothetical protein MLD38_003095 [Melastoma candidum]|uniref:Uncharacterized protein n=1 Tax=Melastoma candidum TaxID=119954 RepID=A0ACB9S5X8_9MYRT|nr:hypothetical protein MLD38_003095 [Melastoma candidum]